MAEIIPAILPKSYDDLESKLNLIRGLVTTVQIDICDGKLVKNATWPYVGDKKHRELDQGSGTHLEAILNQEEGMPGWEDFEFEIDLMVTGTTDVIEEEINKWAQIGASRIILHPIIHDNFLRPENDIIKLFEVARFNNMEVGIAIHIDTPVESYRNAIVQADVVQCMGIEHVGYQGQEFDERVLRKIEEVLHFSESGVISVDGGVGHDNAQLLIDASVNRLIVGSAIFGKDGSQGDARESIEYLQSL